MTESGKTLTCVADCRVGMRVRHVMSGKGPGAGAGEIIEIRPDGVLVAFDNGVRGLYDDVWFKHSGVRLECHNAGEHDGLAE